MSKGGNDAYKNRLVKMLKAGRKCEKTSKEKTNAKKEGHN